MKNKKNKDPTLLKCADKEGVGEKVLYLEVMNFTPYRMHASA